jgi:hypothetical protein
VATEHPRPPARINPALQTTQQPARRPLRSQPGLCRQAESGWTTGRRAVHERDFRPSFALLSETGVRYGWSMPTIIDRGTADLSAQMSATESAVVAANWNAPGAVKTSTTERWRPNRQLGTLLATVLLVVVLGYRAVRQSMGLKFLPMYWGDRRAGVPSRARIRRYPADALLPSALDGADLRHDAGEYLMGFDPSGDSVDGVAQPVPRGLEQTSGAPEQRSRARVADHIALDCADDADALLHHREGIVPGVHGVLPALCSRLRHP